MYTHRQHRGSEEEEAGFQISRARGSFSFTDITTVFLLRLSESFRGD